MLQFEPLTLENAARVQPYYAQVGYRLCEYSVGVKLMWQDYLNPAFCEAAGCLIVRNEVEGKQQFDFPVPGPEGDVEAALLAIEDYCTQKGLPLVLSVVPEREAGRLACRYPVVSVTNQRTWKDYLYRAEDLAEFAGRRYSGQRNHINKFRKLCPAAEFVPLTAEQLPLVERFWQDYEAEFQKESKLAQWELAGAKELFRLLDTGWFRAGGLLNDGRLVALSLGEVCGNTLQVHIEKALYSCPGAYPAMVQAFAKNCGQDVIWLNREDDARDRGLRTSKLQYLPADLGAKLRFDVGTELDSLREIPVIETERLVLDGLRAEDQQAYNAICLDDERNRWWGYDYRQDLHGELTDRYFLDVAEADFAARMCVNFAVRLEGKCIGEVVLYHMDYRGGGELGCRIAPEYAGSGYGTEAFTAVADWALYRLGLHRVVAKCYRENESSFKMLSSCMRKSGEDETFFYFEKLV